MVTTRNLTIYAGDDNRATKTNQSEIEDEKSLNSGKSIKAKELRMTLDLITEKKLSAQKKAWKLIADANKNEGIIDEHVSKMNQRIDELTQDSNNKLQEVNVIHENITNLKNEYHVSDDSQEQKDLELLMKQQKQMQGATDVTLTEEENERLANMGELTDYQMRALGYSETLHKKEVEIEQNNNEIQGKREGITAITIERGKTHGMVDAKATSDKILDAAAKEVMDGLLAEGKDEVDAKIDN